MMLIFVFALTARICPGAGFVTNSAHCGMVHRNRPSSLAATRINPTWDMSSIPNNTAWDIPNYDKVERPTQWVDVDFHYDKPPQKATKDPKSQADDLDVDLIDPELVDVIAPSSYETNVYKSSVNVGGRVFNGPFAGKSGSQAGYVPPFAHRRKGYANSKTSPNKADAKIDWNDLADKMAEAKKELENFMDATKKDHGNPFATATNTQKAPKVGARPRSGRSKACPNVPDVQNWRPPPPEMGGPSFDWKDSSHNKVDVQNPPIEDFDADFVDLSKGPFTGQSGSQAGSTPSCAFKREARVQWDAPPASNGHSSPAINKNGTPQATSPRTTANAADVRIHIDVPTVNGRKPQGERNPPPASVPGPPPVDTYVPPVADASASLGAEAAKMADWDAAPAKKGQKEVNQYVPPTNMQVDSYAPSGGIQESQQVDRRGASNPNMADVKANWNAAAPIKNKEKNTHFQWEDAPVNNNGRQVESQVPYYADMGEPEVNIHAPFDNIVEEEFPMEEESGSEKLNMIDRLFGMRNRVQEPQQATPSPPPRPASIDRTYALPHEIAMAKSWLSERMGCVADAHQEVYARKLVEYGCECVVLLERLVHEGDMERILKDVIGMKPFHFIMLIKGLNGEFRYERRSPFVGRSLWRHVSHRDEYTEVLSWLKAHMRGVPEPYLPGYASKLVDFGCDSAELIDAMIQDQYIDTVQVLEGTIGMKPFHCKLLFDGLMGR